MSYVAGFVGDTNYISLGGAGFKSSLYDYFLLQSNQVAIIFLLQKECDVCDTVFTDEKAYLDHYRIQHEKTKGGRIPCFFCPTTLAGLKPYAKHRNENRCYGKYKMEGLINQFVPAAVTTGKQTPTTPTTHLWKCPICDYERECHQRVTKEEFESIRSHLLYDMREKKAPSVKCPVCPKEYRGDQLSAFTQHTRNHSQLGQYPTDLQTINRDAGAPANEANDDSADNEVFQEIVHHDDQDWSDQDLNVDVSDSESSHAGLSSEEEEVEEEERVQQPQEAPPERPPPAPPEPESISVHEKKFRMGQINFLLALASKHSIGGEALNFIVRHMIWTRRTLQKLTSMGIRGSTSNPHNTEEERNQAENFLRRFLALQSGFGMEQQLKTIYLRKETFNSSCNIVFPKEHFVGFNETGEKRLFAYTTLMSETLGRFFEDESLRDYVITRVPPRGMQQDTGVHAGFTDGKVFKDLTAEGKLNTIILRTGNKYLRKQF